MPPKAFAHRRAGSPQEAGQWDRRHVLATDLRAVGGRAYPRVTAMARDRSHIVFELGMPFLTTTAFVYVYRALQAPQQYVGFVVLGGAMTAFWLNVVWSMVAQLHWERDQGNLELYFTTPIDIMSILLGMALGGLVLSASRAFVIVVVASVLFGVSFAVTDWALLGGVFLLTLAAMYGLGMVLSSVFLMWGREAWHLSQMLIEPVYFVSGLNFPVGRLGLIGAVAIATIPLAVGLDAMRQLAFAGAQSFGPPPPSIEALILLVMTVVFLGIARFTLRTFERLARQEGRLTMRWQ